MISNRTKEEIVSQLTDFFGSRVVSVVLFGSQAKEKAGLNSDIDILAIVKDLPPNWREQDELTGQLLINLWQNGLYNVQFILMTPEQIDSAIEWYNPLILSLVDGYYILYDSNYFFSTIVERIKNLFEIRTVKKRDELVWDIPHWKVI